MKSRRALRIDADLRSKCRNLSEAHVKRLRAVPNRETLLQQCSAAEFVAEIGVATGDFSEKILTICSPSKLYLIDAWEMPLQPIYGEEGLSIVENRFEDQIASGQVEIRRGRSLEVIPDLPECSLDLVYIGASHDYQSVKDDLEFVRSKMRPQGLIAGHDYVRWAGHGKRFGVVEAVNEFCINYSFEFAFLSMEADNNWSFGIRKIE